MATPVPDLKVDQQIANDGSLSSIKQTPAPPVRQQQNNQPAPDAGDDAPKGEMDKGTKVDPNAPPLEVDPNENITMDDFDMAKINSIKTPVKKEAKKDDNDSTISPDPTSKESDVSKADSADRRQDDNGQRADKQQKRQFPKTERDYSQIPEDLRGHFKNMDNEAFATLSPLFMKYTNDLKAKDDTIKKLQEGKDIIPESYYEHENAYMLTPEFGRIASQLQEAQAVVNHWEQQLNDVRAGAKEYKTIVRDPQSGAIVYGPTVASDVNSETDLFKKFVSAQHQLSQTQGALQGVQAGYKTQHQQAKQWVDERNAQWFQPFQDEKQPAAVMAQELFDKAIPSVFKSNPLAPMLAKAMTGFQIMSKLYKDLQEQKGGSNNNGNGKPRQNRQPTEADLGNDGGDGSSKDKGDDVSFDDFKKRMHGALIR